jgi:hypothetical protein
VYGGAECGVYGFLHVVPSSHVTPGHPAYSHFSLVEKQTKIYRPPIRLSKLSSY